MPWLFGPKRVGHLIASNRDDVDRSVRYFGNSSRLRFKRSGAPPEGACAWIRTRFRAGLNRAKDQIKRDGRFATKRGEVPRARIICPFLF